MYTLDEVRPVWTEIDLDRLAHNIKGVIDLADEGSLVTAVIKANAYGHGSIMAAKTFLNSGADRLATATLSEAIEIRKAGIKAPILVLGPTPKKQYGLVLQWDIIQTIFDYESADILSKEGAKIGRDAKVHIKIDTGMGRVGFLPGEAAVDEIIKISKLPNLNVEGIFTHFATADEKDKTYTKLQYQRFTDMVERIEERGLHIPIKHVSNSAAIIDCPGYDLDMVRGGIMIYGFWPSEDVDKTRLELKPAMTLKAKISHVKKIPKGSGISYGKTFVTERESVIATLPIGYADGFTRLLVPGAEVSINGKRAPVVGRICMDQCMVDVTDIDDVKKGDEVVIFGHEDGCPTVEEIANKLGTINYEILCMVGRRVPRVYMKNNEIVEVKDYLLS